MSDEGWSGTATQISFSDVSNHHHEQRHSPLVFLYAILYDTQLQWSTFEKEAFAVVANLKSLHLMVAATYGFGLYTDHNNLIFIFDPHSIFDDLSISCVRKKLGWAVCLSS